MKFNYHLPVNVIFGRGTLNQLGAETAKYGKKALLVISGGSARRSGLSDRVTGLLTAAGVEYAVFDGVTANPLTTAAYAAAELAAREGCGVVVGVGGGSVMDAAKAGAFCALNGGDISDYIFGSKTGLRALPIVLAPTTCGTGSEGNGFAVLTNPDNGDKKSLRSSAIIAKASIVDSEIMETLPRRVLAAVGFDALCHCMEAYLSKSGNPITVAMSLEGLRLIVSALLPLYEGSKNAEEWDALALGSTLGGMVIGTAGVTAAHGLEHPVSGLRNLVHGEGLAALTPIITERTMPYAPEQYAAIARILGGNDCALEIRKLLERLGLTMGLSKLGVTEEDIPWMTANAERVSAAGLNAHPKRFNEHEITEIYAAAM